MSKVVVITGGTRGIGAATAAELGRRGYTVVVTGRTQESADAAAAQLRDDGIDAHGVALDVTSEDSIARATRRIEADHRGVDVLVNNAGILPEATGSDPETVSKTFATNTIGPFLVTAAMLPLLRRSVSGRIVNVSSRMGSLAEQADPASAYYSTVVPAYQASKAALNSYTISLAKSLAGTAIVVTSICPGFVQTDLTPANRRQAPLTPEQAAGPVVAAATASEGSPSGTFVDADGEIRW